jgi:hypothetical protein
LHLFPASVASLPANRCQGVTGVTSILSMPQSVLLGINAGEWGGGLVRIDRANGDVSLIESNKSG